MRSEEIARVLRASLSTRLEAEELEELEERIRHQEHQALLLAELDLAEVEPVWPPAEERP